MPLTRIFLHAALDYPEFESIEPDAYRAMRNRFDNGQSLVMASEAAEAIGSVRPRWAATLAKLEESHMVTIILHE
jgi:hypothetical protein